MLPRKKNKNKEKNKKNSWLPGIMKARRAKSISFVFGILPERTVVEVYDATTLRFKIQRIAYYHTVIQKT